MIKLAFHVGISCYQIYVLHCLSQIRFSTDDPVIKAIQKVNLRFLTNWNFVAQTLFFLFSFVIDVIRITKAFPKLLEKLQRLSSNIFFSIIIPLSVFISIFFWSVYLYNRELIFPRVLDTVMSPWMNHSLHSLIVVNVVIEIILIHHVLPKAIHSMYLLTGFMAVYLFAMLEMYFSQGIWIYPIFDKLTWPLRIVTFALCITIETLILFAGRGVNNILWGAQAEKKSRKKKK